MTWNRIYYKMCASVSDKPGQVIKFIQIYVFIYNVNFILNIFHMYMLSGRLFQQANSIRMNTSYQRFIWPKSYWLQKLHTSKLRPVSNVLLYVYTWRSIEYFQAAAPNNTYTQTDMLSHIQADCIVLLCICSVRIWNVITVSTYTNNMCVCAYHIMHTEFTQTHTHE